jgi:K+-dependent Na+/Ca+ exchanger-like protein
MDPAGIILWFLIMLYMFKALGTVCDEYFVPSLEMISEKLQLSNDVAGATFMAAGSSAPELFTSLVATFLIVNEGGVGTIIGSAIFNILVIVGATCAFAGQELTIWWYPLARDCTFYVLSILELYLTLMDEVVEWYEGLIMFLSYIVYCFYMKINGKVAAKFTKHTEVTDAEAPEEKPKDAEAANGVEAQGPRSAANDAEPGHAAPVEALPKVDHSGNPNSPDYVDDEASGVPQKDAPPAQEGVRPNNLTPDGHAGMAHTPSWSNRNAGDRSPRGSQPTEEKSGEGGEKAAEKDKEGEEKEEEEEEEEVTGWRRFAKDPLLLIWELVMPGPEKYWLLFSLSIFNIALCTYIMVDAVNRIGCNLGISPLFMGLVFLSAGTSVPDALGSIAVAKQGEGDMAVANAFGSNVFDILLGLGVPWLLKAGMGVEVSFKGAASNLAEWMLILAAILVLFIGALIANKWKLNKCMGVTLMTLLSVHRSGPHPCIHVVSVGFL